MYEIVVTREINAPIDKLWDSWDDFANIDKFNPNLNRSFTINGTEATGLGAERQCDFSDGKNHIVERVMVYEPEKRLLVDIYDGTVPLKKAEGDFTFRKLGPARSSVTMTFRFIPKFGLLGRLMVPLIKAQFRPALGKLLDGNKAYLEDGVVIARAA